MDELSVAAAHVANSAMTEGVGLLKVPPTTLKGTQTGKRSCCVSSLKFKKNMAQSMSASLNLPQLSQLISLPKIQPRWCSSCYVGKTTKQRRLEV
jgi:hypothetical protein